MLANVDGISQLKELSLAGHRLPMLRLKHNGHASTSNVGSNGHGVTDAGVAKLQQALPNCKITR